VVASTSGLPGWSATHRAGHGWCAQDDLLSVTLDGARDLAVIHQVGRDALRYVSEFRITSYARARSRAMAQYPWRMKPTPAADPTTYETWSLAAQWVGSGAAVAAVLVAMVFGYLTLASSRRSKDAQERATLIAATDARNTPRTLLAAEDDPERARLMVRHQSGEKWLLVNEGPDVAYSVEIDGLTALDKQRLTAIAGDPHSLGPAQTKEFVLVSRLSLSGPANIVVTFRVEAGGSVLRRVLLVPAP
jgi:hypothetical protein